jgi:hypothetical protein
MGYCGNGSRHCELLKGCRFLEWDLDEGPNARIRANKNVLVREGHAFTSPGCTMGVRVSARNQPKAKEYNWTVFESLEEHRGQMRPKIPSFGKTGQSGF